MKRGEHGAFLKLCHNLVSDKLAAHELLSAMHDTMSHSLYVLQSFKHSVFLVHKGVEDSMHADRMVSYGHFPDKFLFAGGLMLETAGLHTDSFYETFGKKIINLIVLHIKKLILER
jgi:hypothetical protein